MSLFYLKIPFSEIISCEILLLLLWLLHCSFLIFALFGTPVICMTPRYFIHFLKKYFPHVSISLYFGMGSVGLFSLLIFQTIKSIFNGVHSILCFHNWTVQIWFFFFTSPNHFYLFLSLFPQSLLKSSEKSYFQSLFCLILNLSEYESSLLVIYFGLFPVSEWAP